jgi:PAS domain S-box-containing protein
MTPEQFASVANLFSQAALLLTSDGTIQAANRDFERFGYSPLSLRNRNLAELVTTAEDRVRELLLTCSRQREPLVGSLELRLPSGAPLLCRCDGAAVSAPDESPRQLIIRFVPHEESVTRFGILNQKITELSEEIRRRRQLQQALFTQQESLRVTLSSIGDGVIVTDDQARITFMNGEAETLTGWTRDDAIGQPLEHVFRIVNELTRQEVENPVTKVLRERRVVGLANHTVLIARDGTERAIDDSAAPIQSSHEHFSGVVLVFRDVTSKRASEIAKARLAAIIDSSEDAIVGQSLDAVVTDWNAGAERLFGFTPDEAIGRPAFETFVPPDRKQELLDVLDRVQRGERIEHFETVRQHKDGRRLNISIGVSPIQDVGGELLGISAIDRDISDRKRLEQSLRFLANGSKSLASLVDYRSTLQKVARLAVPDFADWCAVDLSGTNGKLERVAVAHVDPDRVQLATEIHERYPPTPGATRGTMRVMLTGEPELIPDIDESLLRESARDEAHLRLLKDLNLRSYMCLALKTKQKTLGAITFVFAESGRRYGEDDLAMAQDFAHRATVAIENARLYHELREADRRKDEFLAMLAHELRNPLMPIQTGLDVLAMELSEPHDALQVMKQQVEHLIRLVDDLLDVSRIMRGRIELRTQPVSVQTVVRQSVNAVKSNFESRSQQLVVQMHEQELWLKADAVRLVQVLENLLTNASKYTDPGGRIELSVEAGDGQVAIRVRDNGSGLDPDILPKVFELFSQSPRTLDRSQGGLGIGLTLVRNLVNMHHGSVTAESPGIGQGSTFTVTLPVSEPTSAPSPPVPAPSEQSGSCRILVVDDNAGAARMLALLLSRLAAHQVTTAHDGEAALSIIEQFRPEMILLDIGLPGMNGYEVAHAIRQDERFQHTLLVALTGYGQLEDRRRSKDAGFDEHLVKPPTLEDIKKLFVHPKLRR